MTRGAAADQLGASCFEFSERLSPLPPTMAASSGAVLLLYSASICVLSLYAFLEAGREWSRAKTAVIMGGGSAGA